MGRRVADTIRMSHATPAAGRTMRTSTDVTPGCEERNLLHKEHNHAVQLT